MANKDLRDWIIEAEKIGELTRVEGAHWDLELGAIVELVQRQYNANALLFDRIGDYPAGYRVLSNSTGSADRMALTCGLPLGLTERDFMQAWRHRSRELRPIEPLVVQDGPVMENVHTGDDINMLEFPTPRWHDGDGGRYIGTAHVDITRDPDSGVVNLGTYRVMVYDQNHVSFHISPGKDGRIHRDKYFAAGKPCPVVMSFGHHPLFFFVGSTVMPHGWTEYQFLGGLMGEPIDVIPGPVTGLPFPATSEIVIEGIATLEDRRKEGPFGEWTGYYASGSQLIPAVEVKAVYHRHNPIILSSPPAKPPSEVNWGRNFLRSIDLEEALAAAGVPDVQGAWFHSAGGSRFLIVIGIKQRYAGHARQAAQAALASRIGAYLARYVIVVDEDVDITNLEEVMWAVCTRSDPANDIEILRRGWSGPLDPAIHPDHKGHNSRAVIDACRPFEWRDRFPKVAEVSPELKEQTLAKWRSVIYPGK